MDLKIRPIVENDIKEICQFSQSREELFYFFPKAQYPLSPSELRTAISQRSESTVVELDGKVVAFANFYQWDMGGKCCIGNVVVASEARGLGVAHNLIQHMVGLAFSKYQAREVSVACFHRNLAGLLLYPKLGFTPYAIEERTDFEGGRVALIHMRKLNSAHI